MFTRKLLDVDDQCVLIDDDDQSNRHLQIDKLMFINNKQIILT